MMILNVFIPSKFVIAAHGTLTEKQKKSETFRPSVDGLLEDYLSGGQSNRLVSLIGVGSCRFGLGFKEVDKESSQDERYNRDSTNGKFYNIES